MPGLWGWANGWDVPCVAGPRAGESTSTSGYMRCSCNCKAQNSSSLHHSQHHRRCSSSTKPTKGLCWAPIGLPLTKHATCLACTQCSRFSWQAIRRPRRTKVCPSGTNMCAHTLRCHSWPQKACPWRTVPHGNGSQGRASAYGIHH